MISLDFKGFCQPLFLNPISFEYNQYFGTDELDVKATVRKFRTVQQEGERLVNKDLEYYNLNAIISVGYTCKKQKGLQSVETLCGYTLPNPDLNGEAL